MGNNGLTYLTNEDRLESVRQACDVAMESQEEFDVLTEMAIRALRVPVALVSLVKSDRQCFVGASTTLKNWEGLRETPLSHSFCQHVVAKGQPLVVDDAREHPLVCENLATLENLVRSYAGAPVMLESGECLGSFCVIDTEPRHWSGGELHLVGHFARLAAQSLDLVMQRRISSMLRERLRQLEKEQGSRC